MKNTVNIRPRVSILSVLKHLNYKSWYALAEFVDNAIDSYEREKKTLRTLEKGYALQVSIEINTDANKITIRDNAGGIHPSEFDRAFRTAEIPPDRTGLSEFGMGMKSASCWFTNNWSVRTKSLDDGYEHEVKFDVTKIVHDQVEELDIKKKKVREDAHYTVIELDRVHNVPVKKTLGKIKEHLSSIYRQFIRDGKLKLILNGEELQYEEPAVLLAPFYKDEKKSMSVSWRKEIDIQIDKKHRATGFAAIREIGSVSDAGFALFRRGRVIQGSSGEGYRPEAIFGQSNDHRYQRIFGELHLVGFGVSHTKDGIQWAGLEETFIKLLKQELKKNPDLIAQASGYRKRLKSTDLKHTINAPLTRTTSVLQREGAKVVEDLRERTPDPRPVEKNLPTAEEAMHKVILLEMEDDQWEVHLELTFDESVRPWVDIGDNYIKGKRGSLGMRQVGIRMSLVHPFMVQFTDPSRANIEPFIRIAAAIGIGETIARESGVKYASEIRKNINDLLADALSKPE